MMFQNHLTAILFICGWLVLLPGYAQNSASADIAVLAEELFARQDGDVTYDELYDQLLFRFTDPLDLNSATPEEIRSLHLFSDCVGLWREARAKSGAFEPSTSGG